MSPSIRHWLTLVGLALSFPALAGAPMLRENCVGPDQQPVRTVYSASSTVYFAEARMVRPEERPEAVARGVPLVAIYVNPERYFLGERTQQWLYQRQCVHLQQRHRIATEGVRALDPADEARADCEGLRALAQADPKAARMVRLSIESDMQRLLRDGRWSQVLPGPQRVIAFDRCSPPL